ncbi:MAG: efflux RND transporter periplasmic adaptor subunit [Planctomycetes bacterium]|nr:efflux RND transporter periplasmic adaptor subunit [Planctomycetota bacterium]
MNALKEKIFKIFARVGTKLVMLHVLILVLAVGFWLGRRGGAPEPDTRKVTAETETKAAAQVWICSMHPHIRRTKPGLCPVCNMELIPVSTDETETLTSMRQLTVSENAKKLMDIVVAPVERKFVSAVVRMVGKVDYDETKLAYITAWLPGRLDRLYVDYTGVHVNKGDHMVYLYSPELISAQEELLQALEAVKNTKETELSIMREMTEAMVKAARNKLRLWGIKAEQIEKIERTGKVEDHMTIYAPAGGIVIHKNGLEGMYVKEGTRIYTIADLSQVWIKLDAYESDLEWLRYGQEVEFTTVAYPGSVFEGTISFIDPILNERTRSVKIRVNVPNPDGRLKPGMFIKATVRARVAAGGRIMDADLVGKWICPMHPEVIKSNSGECDICQMPLKTTESLGYVSDDPAQMQKPLVIPVNAALVTGTRAIVYVELPDTEVPTFEGREIVLGPRAGDYYLVRSGLKEGERVVVKGNFKIDSDLQIMARPSMMTPDGAGGVGESLELPAKFRYQLQAILAAAQEVEKALAREDITKVQSAFKAFGRSIKEVDMKRETGRPHLLWMEMKMRLSNDVLEGVEARTLKDAHRIGGSVADNIKSLMSKFGLKREIAKEPRSAVSDAFRSQLAKVFAGYFAMQQGLTEDKPQAAAEAAQQTLTAVKAVQMKLLAGEDHNLWMKCAAELENILAEATQAASLESSRESFNLLSQQLIKVARRFGSTGDKPFYILNCPMAFDNKGADWLQSDEQTRNPYFDFGQMMLKCGSVKEVIGVKEIWKEEDN